MRNKIVYSFICGLALSFTTGCANQKIKITWVNYDGTVLEVDENVTKNQMPYYDGNVPARFEDENNYYIFKEWSPEIKKATKSATYTAVFESFARPTLTENPISYTDALPSDTKDGSILHAFCWTFNDIKANLKAISEAGYKSVQTSPVQTPKSNGSSWWAYYQPLSFSIATRSPLGTKEELEELCAEADNYGVSIIVDVVFNHLAQYKENAYEADGTPVVSPEVEKYEPEIYALRNDATNPTFHHNLEAAGSGSDTQYYGKGKSDALPDLNTAHPLVQARALAFLKECIDAGVDGFRFDAAKHIETPDDPDYPSNFWPNTLGVAKEYYKTVNNGKELFAYGEILGSPTNRSIDVYTKYMAVTDDYSGSNIVNGAIANSGQRMTYTVYGKDTDASNIVRWLESHDTFTSTDTPFKAKRIAQSWPLLVSRKDSRGLFLARPDSAFSIGIVNDYQFKDETIASANRFHNRFKDGEEYLSYSNGIGITERVNGDDKGAIIVDSFGGSMCQVDLPHLGSGVYYNQLNGEKVNVFDGHAVMNLDENGVAILTKTHNEPRPTIDISNRSGVVIDSMNVTVKTKNGTKSTYKINNGDAVEFNGEKTIVIRKADAVNGYINLTITVSNSQFTTTETFKYQAVELVAGYFNVININPAYFTDYTIRLWSWETGKWGCWNQNYTRHGETTMLVDSSKLAGFLLALFEKGYEVPNVNSWDYDGVIKQTVDISGELLKQGYFDASTF